jgi:hypothetical protein
MDLYSPRGQVAGELAREELDRINSQYDFNLIPLVDNFPSAFDGLVEKDGHIVATYEVRTRNATVIGDQINFKFNNKYKELVVTKSKIDKCVRISSEMYLPFCLIIKFKNRTLQWWISDSFGKHLFDMKTIVSENQKTINGGLAIRENYLIPVTKGKVI